MTITEFLLARIAEDEAESWELLPYSCPPDCCAPAGYVGHRCLICGEESFGGTPEAITEICRDHAEVVHQRSRVLAECEAERRIVEEHGPRVVRPIVDIYDDECQTCHGSEPGAYPCLTLRHLASVYADHPDYRKEWRP